MKRLLFVDTNIFLDFYRVESDAALNLLVELESKKSDLIFTYKVDVEFKKNRQSVIHSGLKSMKTPDIQITPQRFSKKRRLSVLYPQKEKTLRIVSRTYISGL